VSIRVSKVLTAAGLWEDLIFWCTGLTGNGSAELTTSQIFILESLQQQKIANGNVCRGY
jgi:hypothetical protein